MLIRDWTRSSKLINYPTFNSEHNPEDLRYTNPYLINAPIMINVTVP